MSRTITVAAAQTGPVLSDDWRDSVPAACAMIDQVATAQTSLPWWRDRRPELYDGLGA